MAGLAVGFALGVSRGSSWCGVSESHSLLKDAFDHGCSGLLLGLVGAIIGQTLGYLAAALKPIFTAIDDPKGFELEYGDAPLPDVRRTDDR
jgi:hypothetical protein